MDAQAETLEKSRTARSVTGHIDAITGGRIYGWAWDPQRPEAHIDIRIRGKGGSVTALTANQRREDLRANHIGDGDHAFESSLPEGVSPDEVRVFAVHPGTEELIELTPRLIAVASDLGTSDDVRLALRALHGAQQTLFNNLQSLSKAIESLRRNMAASSSAVDPAQARLDILDVAILRIDKILQEQGVLVREAGRQSSDPISRILAGAAAVLAAASLVIVLLH